MTCPGSLLLHVVAVVAVAVAVVAVVAVVATGVCKKNGHLKNDTSTTCQDPVPQK